MSKQQQHHFDYTLYFKERGSNSVSTYTSKGRLLSDVLMNFCNYCVDTDWTGVFFELENADLEFLKKDPKFHIVKTKYGVYGIVLEDLKLEADRRNPLLLALRAKRELLGLNIPQMIKLVDCPSYKAKEDGRPMKAMEYNRFMDALDRYEKSGDFEGIANTSKSYNEDISFAVKNKDKPDIGKEIAYQIRINKLSKEDFEEIEKALLEQKNVST